MYCDNWTISSMGPSCGLRMKHLLIWLPARFSHARWPALRSFLTCLFPARNKGRGGYALCSVLWLVTFAAGADNAQKLDQFLNRLGLTDLRLTHMERLLARETVADKRLAMARQLADAYAEELVSAADESERFAALKTRVEKLLA